MTHVLEKEADPKCMADIYLEQTVPILKNVKYDLSLKWMVNYFQTKNGNSGKEKVNMIKFSKSSFDNNGTSVSSGQIAGLLISHK